MNQQEQGLYHKFNISRTDGTDAPGGKHFGDEYFVLNLTTDKHTIPAIAAYAESCAAEYPLLASDLRAKVAATVKASSLFITVPEVTLPSGKVVPSFQVAQYIASRGPAGIPQSVADAMPWVEVNYDEARKACAVAGYDLLAETRALAIAYDISQQDINWTGEKVGEGKIFQGIHKDNVSEAQAGTYESDDTEERRWHQLSNGERIYDFAGNCYTWVFDDVQGDENGLAGKIAADSISITTAPAKSQKSGMGWYPEGGANWSGNALMRGGCWGSGSGAGVFYLYDDYPGDRDDGVGFRCTKSL
ncbi:MAG: SUMF1/EgtB/PvdO family nonheme iron enzyme [Alphaproteobacteria bacterium]